MKRIILVLHCFILWNDLPAQEFHISPQGNDKNPGTIQKPVASLEAAKQLVRAYKKVHGIAKGGIHVWIHAGTYQLSNTFRLEAEDSGTPDRPVIWEATTPNSVSISGGINIPPNTFTRIPNKNVLEQLSDAAQQHVMQSDLKKQGINDYGINRQFGFATSVMPSGMELFFNHAPMTLARYPNQGNIKIGKVIDPGSVPRNGDQSNRGALFNYSDPHHKKWIDAKDMWFSGTFNYGFADDNLAVEKIDTNQHQVKLARPHIYGVGAGNDFQQYIAVNILEELDEPGEWYVDKTTGMLYVWPPSSMKEAIVQLSILESPIIVLKNVSNVQLKGFTVENGRGMGIYLENVNNNLIAGCTVRNVGTSGIFMGKGSIPAEEGMSVDNYRGIIVSEQIGNIHNHLYQDNVWNREAGKNNRIISCDVYNTGSGGIYLSGGDKKTLSPGNNVIENCRIHDYNRRNKFTWAGINVDGCGNKVSHCEIYNSDFQGIFVHGNEHVFEYNNIHDVTLNSNDTSPWYIGRNPSDRGNIVRYNYIHDCGNPNRMNMGIYCDDSSTDVYVFGNIFVNMNTNHGVVFSNDGWDIKVKNNIIVHPVSHAAVVSALWYTWAAPQVKSMFGEKGLIRKRLEVEVDFNNPPYSIKYTGLLPYLDEIEKGKEWEGMRARNNSFESNLIVGGPDNPIELMGGKYAQMENRNNWVTKGDPGFEDMQHGNFNLKPSSEAYQKIQGFQILPFNKMGLYKDTYRK